MNAFAELYSILRFRFMTTTDPAEVATTAGRRLGRRNLAESCDSLKMDPKVGEMDFLHVVKNTGEDCPVDWRVCTVNEIARVNGQSTGMTLYVLQPKLKTCEAI